MVRYFLFFILTLISFAACKDDDDQRVPNVPVDITLSLNLPQWQPLNTPGGWVYVTGGSRGIIVYRAGTEEFTAMDRHCPYEPINGDRVHVLEDNIIAADTNVCGSRFVITDGSVTQGPASFPLTTYRTSYNGAINELRVFN
ncbi:MAG: hypothetical protein HKN79_04595 [Flavobacteriales bacterium]|nr:hypothetical protein [Flavobacteriales bacterium]